MWHYVFGFACKQYLFSCFDFHWFPPTVFGVSIVRLFIRWPFNHYVMVFNSFWGEGRQLIGGFALTPRGGSVNITLLCCSANVSIFVRKVSSEKWGSPEIGGGGCKETREFYAVVMSQFWYPATLATGQLLGMTQNFPERLRPGETTRLSMCNRSAEGTAFFCLFLPLACSLQPTAKSEPRCARAKHPAYNMQPYGPITEE